MSLAILFHFLCAQHVSDINISIIRSLRLFCRITTLVVLFLVRCGGVSVWLGWSGICVAGWSTFQREGPTVCIQEILPSDPISGIPGGRWRRAICTSGVTMKWVSEEVTHSTARSLLTYSSVLPFSTPETPSKDRLLALSTKNCLYLFSIKLKTLWNQGAKVSQYGDIDI